MKLSEEDRNKIIKVLKEVIDKATSKELEEAVEYLEKKDTWNLEDEQKYFGEYIRKYNGKNEWFFFFFLEK